MDATGGVLVEEPAAGTRKQENYKLQMARLNKAMKAGFYLEAVLIEQAIIEDRLQSILEHAGVYNPEKHKFFKKKLDRVKALTQNKKGLAHRYFNDGILDEVDDWRSARNDIVHRLMSQSADFNQLHAYAARGQELTKTLRNKARSFNRMVDKQTSTE